LRWVCRGCARSIASPARAGGARLDRRRHATQPRFHEIGLTVAIILGALALGRGIFEHGYMAPAVTGSLGLGMMAGAMQLPMAMAGRRYGR